MRHVPAGSHELCWMNMIPLRGAFCSRESTAGHWGAPGAWGDRTLKGYPGVCRVQSCMARSMQKSACRERSCTTLSPGSVHALSCFPVLALLYHTGGVSLLHMWTLPNATLHASPIHQA